MGRLPVTTNGTHTTIYMFTLRVVAFANPYVIITPFRRKFHLASSPQLLSDLE